MDHFEALQFFQSHGDFVCSTSPRSGAREWGIDQGGDTFVLRGALFIGKH